MAIAIVWNQFVTWNMSPIANKLCSNNSSHLGGAHHVPGASVLIVTAALVYISFLPSPVPLSSPIGK